MVNTEYEPNDDEVRIINLLQENKSDGGPWGRVNPMYVRDRTGFSKQRVNHALNQLVAAGWVKKLTEGLYEFVADPRD